MRRDFFDYAGAEAMAMACAGQSKALERLRRRRRARQARRHAAQAEQGLSNELTDGRGAPRRSQRRRGDRWFAPAAIGAAALGWVGWAAAIAAELQLGKDVSVSAVLLASVIPAALSVGVLLLVAVATPNHRAVAKPEVRGGGVIDRNREGHAATIDRVSSPSSRATSAS